MKEYDFLIVGQGLAGSMLAYQLSLQSKSFLVVDEGLTLTSSKVAAGMFNPVGGKRFLNSWLSYKLLPYAKKIYTDLEKLLNVSFYFEQPILNYFKSQDSADVAFRRLYEDEYDAYIQKNPTKVEQVKDEYDSLLINHGGWVNTQVLLENLSQWLQSNQKILLEEFEYKKLLPEEDNWTYKGNKFKKVVFCEGYKATNNPFFENLPFVLCKGEVFKILAEGLPKEVILKKGVYLVNLTGDYFKVGSTYEWKDLEPKPSEKGFGFITGQLDNFLRTDYKVIEHFGGVRPAIKDRRPILGESPKHKNIFIFNGLGTKGVLLSPYFSEELVNYMIKGTSVHPEVALERFVK